MRKGKPENQKKYYSGIKFSIQISEKDMVNFVLTHSYRQPAAWIGILFSLLAIVFLICQFESLTLVNRLIMLFVGLIFTVINPMLLRSKAIKQAHTNLTVQKPATYILSERVLVIEQGKEQLTVPWESLFEIRDTGRSLVIYLDRSKAFIWPKAKLGEKYDQVTTVLREKITDKRLKIKK